jgi:hypothetical protein
MKPFPGLTIKLFFCGELNSSVFTDMLQAIWI